MRSRRMHGQSPHILSEAPQAVPQLIWARAEGCRVWDAEGREYIDLTGGFGVAALGHRNPRVMEAIAAAIFGLRCPSAATPKPPVKSMYSRPSASQTRQPSALAQIN